MLKLSVTAKDSPVNIQDPRPVHNTGDEQASYTVQPGETKEMVMSRYRLSWVPVRCFQNSKGKSSTCRLAR